MTDLNRKHAFSNVKSAVRSYAKDPTAKHAKQVEDAWREIRRMDGLSHWRERRAARLNAHSGSERSKSAH